MKNSDVQLIERVLSGDETAFTELVEKYQKPVHTLAWRKIGDFHIAEEITQDTFLKVYQKLHTLKDPHRFAGWLYVIATRRCLAWQRRKRIQTQPLADAETTPIKRDAYSQHIVEQRAETTAEVQREVVKKLLVKLPESERTVLMLRYFSEMSSAEIGEFLGVSANTIRSRLRRAQQRLQKEETMIREALDHFQISPTLTDTIMREVARLKPGAPSGSKPLVPWAIAAASAILLVLMLGIDNQYLARFQQPYSLDAQSERVIELVDAPIAQNVKAKPDVRNQPGKLSDTDDRNNGDGEKANQVLGDEGGYTRWNLPVDAKRRLGKGVLNNMQLSPDGTRLAVASSIGIWLYDADSGKELALLTGHTAEVLSVAFSPDGKTLASGSFDSTIRLWDVQTGELLKTLIEHTNVVFSLAFNPDGKTLASGSHDGLIHLSDVQTGRILKTTEHTDWVMSVAFSPDGKTLASGSKDSTIQLWDTETNRVQQISVGHTSWVTSVAFSPDGKTLVSGSRDGTLLLWEITLDATQLK